MKVNISKSCEIPMYDIYDVKPANFVVSIIGFTKAEVQSVPNPLGDIDSRYPGFVGSAYGITDTSGFMAQKMRTNEL